MILHWLAHLTGCNRGRVETRDGIDFSGDRGFDVFFVCQKCGAESGHVWYSYSDLRQRYVLFNTTDNETAPVTLERIDQ